MMQKSRQPETENQAHETEDLESIIEEDQRRLAELSRLFGRETVEMAREIDSADLNLNDVIVQCITDGIRQLKSLQGHPDEQGRLIAGMTPGERLLLCLWILDMDLLDRI